MPHPAGPCARTMPRRIRQFMQSRATEAVSGRRARRFVPGLRRVLRALPTDHRFSRASAILPQRQSDCARRYSLSGRSRTGAPRTRASGCRPGSIAASDVASPVSSGRLAAGRSVPTHHARGERRVLADATADAATRRRRRAPPRSRRARPAARPVASPGGRGFERSREAQRSRRSRGRWPGSARTPHGRRGHRPPGGSAGTRRRVLGSPSTHRSGWRNGWRSPIAAGARRSRRAAATSSGPE